MKIERISDNQIRCTLNSFDLSVRNLNLGELAYGTEKARRLFREMIQRASSEVGFEADDIPLMVEAIPLAGESIMLVITKIEDPEELDTRFAQFSPSAEEDNMLSQLTNQILEGAEGLTEYLEPGTEEDAQKEIEAAKDNSIAVQHDENPVSGCRIYRFGCLDRICDAARATGSIYGGKNTLYKKPDTRQYYLVVKRMDCNDLEFSRVCNILAEYGTKLQNEYTSEAYYREHYEIIVNENALQALQTI